VCTLVAAAFLISDSEKNTPAAFLLQLGLLQTWVPYHHYTFSFNAPAWSISDEAFFYALFPLVVVALFRMRLSLAKCIATICALYLTLTVLVVHSYSSAGSFEWAMFQFPPTRLVEFVCGMLVAEAYSQNALKIGKWTATALEVLGPVAFLLAAILPIPPPLIGTSFTTPLAVVIVFVFALSNGYVSRFLSARPFVYLGEISFAIYMVHYIIVREVNTGFAIALTMAAAIFAHELIEKPCQRYLLRLFDERKPSPAAPNNASASPTG
jgi:peptidoglycan/LPS O-acetylase OafA/YrhL